MLQNTTNILLDCFRSLVNRIFIPLASYYELFGLCIGIFVTYSLFRFLFIPLFTGSNGVGKFVSGSDHARKKDDD